MVQKNLKAFSHDYLVKGFIVANGHDIIPLRTFSEVDVYFLEYLKTPKSFWQKYKDFCTLHTEQETAEKVLIAEIDKLNFRIDQLIQNIKNTYIHTLFGDDCSKEKQKLLREEYDLKGMKKKSIELEKILFILKLNKK